MEIGQVFVNLKILVAMVPSTLENNVMMEIPEAETGALIVGSKMDGYALPTDVQFLHPLLILGLFLHLFLITIICLSS